jgi:hypothetical protein
MTGKKRSFTDASAGQTCSLWSSRAMRRELITSSAMLMAKYATA